MVWIDLDDDSAVKCRIRFGSLNWVLVGFFVM